MAITDNAASLARLLDEAAIRDATTRFADSAISADYDGFRALWAEDAALVIGGTENQPFERRAKGIDDIVSLFRKLRDERDYLSTPVARPLPLFREHLHRLTHAGQDTAGGRPELSLASRLVARGATATSRR